MNRWVPLVNAAAWILAVGVASLGLPLQFYNSVGYMCAVGAAPVGCRGETCTRGGEAHYFLFATWGLTWFLSAGIFYHYFAIIRHVRSIEVRASKFTASQAMFRYSTDSVLDAPMAEAQSEEVDRSKSNSVASQAMLLASYLFLVIILETSLVLSLFFTGHQTSMSPALMGLDITVKALSSLQGFVYFLIYARSRFDMKTPEGRIVRGALFGLGGQVSTCSTAIVRSLQCTRRQEEESACDKSSAVTLDTRNMAGESFISTVSGKSSPSTVL